MTTLFDSDRRIMLWEYVRDMHAKQQRKYTGEPYHNHLLAVAELACRYETSVPYVLEVAICHDLLEDTECTSEQLVNTLRDCGYEGSALVIITAGVQDLSDQFTSAHYSHLNRRERKHLESIRLGKISPWLQSIKYADMVDNSISIAKHDPEFARIYLPEKKNLLNQMRNGNIDLLILCCCTLVQSEIEILSHKR